MRTWKARKAKSKEELQIEARLRDLEFGCCLACRREAGAIEFPPPQARFNELWSRWCEVSNVSKLED